MNATESDSVEYGGAFDREEMLNLLMEEVSDYVIVHTASGAIKLMNKSAENGLGPALNEHNLPAPEVTYFFASPPALIMKNAWKSLDERRPFMAEGVVRRRDGSSFRALISSHILTRGAEPFVLTIAKDLTAAESAGAGASAADARDPITGLLNSSSLEEELRRLDLDRQLPISIITGKLNGIKIVNNAFGRQVGDGMLRAAARTLRKVCRSCDLIFRREESGFAILLPHTKEAHAAGIAERIENTFRETRVKDLPVSPSISTGYSAKLNRWQDISNVLKEAEEDMQKKQSSQNPKMRTAILESILTRLGDTTPETPDHILRVRQICRLLGRLSGLDSRDLELLDLAAHLHDIGKISIPARVLSRAGPLAPDEREEIKRHSETGYNVAMAATSGETAVADAILSHHERWDGKGYPYGLDGDKIPLLSRIIALGDAFDVMTRGTPYRAAMPAEEGLREVEMQSGRQFDPHLASLLIDNRELLEGAKFEKLPPVRKFSVE